MNMQHYNIDEEEQVMESRVPIKTGTTPPRIRLVSGSSHISLGDVDLLSVPSFHSIGSDNLSIFDGGDQLTQVAKGKKKATFSCCKHTRRHFWYHPIVRALRRRYRKVPARYKYICFLTWVSWKFVAAFLVVYLVQSSSEQTTDATALRILYIVTASSISKQEAESTWIESIKDLADGNYHTDAVLILGDETLDKNIEASWSRRLPPSATLSTWVDAIPWKNENGRVVENHDALWLQHRFVLKDEWFDHDVFIVFDSDIQITKTHVDYVWKQSKLLSSRDGEPSVAIPGFIPVSRVPKDLRRMEEGPFETDSVVGSTLLLEEASLKLREDNSRIALLPLATQQRMGWMMTKWQLASVVQQCPLFLPSVDNEVGDCSFQLWLDLDFARFPNHIVQRSRAAPPSSSSLSPNRLWEELGGRVTQ